MTEVKTLKERREGSGLSIEDLVRQSGVGRTTIDRIEAAHGKYSVNIGTAELIADALGCTVSEIDWPNGTSDRGRPPRTGRPIIRTQSPNLTRKICGTHFIELPRTSECAYC